MNTLTTILLCSSVIFVSITLGIALGRLLQNIEKAENKWLHAHTNSPEKNHAAPGADWGTWSTTM